MSIDEDKDFASVAPTSNLDARSLLTLLDIMVGVTIAAVTCGFWLQSSPSQPLMIQILFLIPLLISFVLGGTTLFSFGRRYWLKQPIDFQPGHWLLCLMGVAFVVQAIAHVVKWATIATDELAALDNQYATTTFYLSQNLAFLVCFLVAGILLPVRPAWRLALIAPVLQSLLSFLLLASLLFEGVFPLGEIYSFANVTINGLGIVTLLSLATWDRATTHDRRDWMHWLGVVAMVMWNVPMLLIQFANFF